MFIIKWKKNNKVTEYICDNLNLYLSDKEIKTFNDNGINFIKNECDIIIWFELDLDKFDIKFYLVSPVLDEPYEEWIKLTKKNCEILKDKKNEEIVWNYDEVWYLEVAFEIVKKDNREIILYIVLD